MDKVIQKADIERYALGLTSPRETARIERAMEAQPELRQLVKDIQRDLHEYAEKIDIPPLRPGTTPDPNRFLELDGEMLEILSAQNARLQRWVSVLSLIIFLLAAAGGYLYYLNGQLQTQLTHDRASLRQELNYQIDHRHAAEQRMDAWKSAAQFETVLPIDNLEHEEVDLYTFETGEKILLNIAGIPDWVEELVVRDERRPNHIIRRIDCRGKDKLHYVDLTHRDQVKRLKVSAIIDSDVALSE